MDAGETQARSGGRFAASRKAGAAVIRIRSCAGMAELDACVQLQIETWGYDKTEAIPRKMFLLAQKIGGQVIGVFESEMQEDSFCQPRQQP